jgi:hypothetical protein
MAIHHLVEVEKTYQKEEEKGTVDADLGPALEVTYLPGGVKLAYRNAGPVMAVGPGLDVLVGRVIAVRAIAVMAATVVAYAVFSHIFAPLRKRSSQ